MLVPDVLEFPGHIACDADTRSEIVVPIIFDEEVCSSRVDAFFGRGRRWV